MAAPEIADRIDPKSLAFEPEEHYSGGPTRHARRADLITKAQPMDDTEAKIHEEDVLLHAEIELQYRARTIPRLLRYHRGLSLKYALLVHTIVLFLRGGPAGSQAMSFEERSLDRPVCRLNYHSLGLSRASASGFLARPEPLAWAFAALMQTARGQPRSKLGLECVARIAAETTLSRREHDLLLACVLTYAGFDDDDAQIFDKITTALEDEEVQTVKMSMTERWHKEGLEKGRELGLEQGKELGLEQGRAEGIRDMVLRLLSQRFGALSSEARRRIAAITSADELGKLAESVYAADSLKDLGLA